MQDIEEFFKIKPTALSPESVLHGIMKHHEFHKDKDSRLERQSYAMGVELMSGLMQPVIPSDALIPGVWQANFVPNSRQHTRFNIFQGKYKLCCHNTLIGTIQVNPDLITDEIVYKLLFEVNTNG